ncbi:MAG: CpaD family pilus assembly protein [Flavobacteriaceae bacterium]
MPSASLKTITGALSRAALLALAATAAGCAANRHEITHSVALNYADRHPIHVGYQSRDMIIVPDPAFYGMNPKDRTDLIGYLRAYRAKGESVLQVATPSGTPNEGLTHTIVGEIRTLAAGEGIRPENVLIAPYNAGGNPNAPVYLSYSRFAASVPRCGLWPKSFAAGSQNLDYYNFGCATQQNLAAIVANPRDLTGPQAEDPGDPNRRRTVFDKYRQGQDTATIRADAKAGTASKVSE